MTTLNEIEAAAREHLNGEAVINARVQCETILALTADLRACHDALNQHNNPWYKDASEKALQNLKKWGL